MIQEYTYSKKAMGTDIYLSVFCDSEIKSTEIAQYTFNQIDKYEKIFSRFIPESELSILNRTKHKEVSRDFMEVILESYKLFKKTEGVFNPLVQIEKFGYDRNFLDIKSGSVLEHHKINYDIDFDKVIINTKLSTITLTNKQKLDYGGFLKGYLAEKICKEIYKDHTDLRGVILNIGGDIYTQGLDTKNKKIIFEIYNPITEEYLPIQLHNQALATSGTYARKWQTKQGIYNHILDKSGLKNPKGGILSASVVADKGTYAEAYAKTLLITDFENPPKNISYILIKKDGKIVTNIK